MDTILIIDDDININNMLCETLQNEGYAVLRAYSGTEAMMLLSDKKPDLILLDLMLPGLSGEQLLPKIEDQRTVWCPWHRCSATDWAASPWR